MKNNRGIALVALVITIIVLIILAAVVITTLRDNGIVTKAQEAKNSYEAGAQNEDVRIKEIENMVSGNSGESMPPIEELYGTYVTKDGLIFNLSEGAMCSVVNGTDTINGTYHLSENTITYELNDGGFYAGEGIYIKNLRGTATIEKINGKYVISVVSQIGDIYTSSTDETAIVSDEDLSPDEEDPEAGIFIKQD